ncbi:N-acetylmuramoyl-L-alanine amidase [Caulobacter sp. SLTY]|uniref:peptidoglycan recognition protein family protein n=1 Tax=Caulobacter sp. SLTY TaxID=2683262 RepID=UPI001411F8CF|nr:N-acetylmuramoyl-L-alanine amidase [Caulobacter sp. SLTY]NBB13911.1 N-acetylmuramoyl-L-alanine amidase [Caulobacter sp. SLTY]
MLRSELGKQLNLTIAHIASGRPNRPGTPLMPMFITVHNTDNTHAGAGAAAHARFVRETGYYMHNNRQVWISWHYTVDDKETYRHLPLNEVGWHAGTREGNATSIGVEVCMNSDGDQDAAFDRAVKLLACLTFDMGVEPRDVLRTHYHWSGKQCPRLLLNEKKPGKKWAAFVDRVQALNDSIVPG